MHHVVLVWVFGVVLFFSVWVCMFPYEASSMLNIAVYMHNLWDIKQKLAKLTDLWKNCHYKQGLHCKPRQDCTFSVESLFITHILWAATYMTLFQWCLRNFSSEPFLRCSERIPRFTLSTRLDERREVIHQFLLLCYYFLDLYTNNTGSESE